MRFDVITLFPELFEPFLRAGVTRRAFESGQVDVRLWPLRDYGEGNYRRVDDRPFGGGPGMVLLAEPLERALAAVRTSRQDDGAPVVHFSPAGAPLSQPLVRRWASDTRGAVLLCGRYEGIDARVLARHVTYEISLGDFVLSGGELPALALLDAVARLKPGVLGDERSHQQDSFENGLLDHPHYSSPPVWAVGGQTLPVPPVLLSGHHGDIARWRREQALAITASQRPDLIAAARSAGRISADDERTLATPASTSPTHQPVPQESGPRRPPDDPA